METDFKSLAERLKAVAHPIRLRVLALLGTGELCVCQIVEVLQVPQSTVSESLRELRRAGFVTERKEGRWVFVSAAQDPGGPPLLQVLLAESMPLAEAERDRARADQVRKLAVPVVCGRVMGPSGAEAVHA
jgi:DNA-binding transcriptional ArsR family regulator